MVEQRLGVLGKPAAKLVIVALVLGVVSWGFRLFWDNAIWPLTQGINRLMDAELRFDADAALAVVISWAITAVGIGFMWLLADKVLFQRLRRRIAEDMRHLQDYQARMREHLAWHKQETEPLWKRADEVLTQSEAILAKAEQEKLDAERILQEAKRLSPDIHTGDSKSE